MNGDEYVMRVLGVETAGAEQDLSEPPCWVQTFDVEAFGGRGDAILTTDRDKAQRFPTFTAVLAAWQSVPTAMPIRSDGKPNRPLTAFTVEPEKAS